MKSTDVKTTITLHRDAKVTGFCIAILDTLYVDNAKKVVRALAAFYGLTCS